MAVGAVLASLRIAPKTEPFAVEPGEVTGTGASLAINQALPWCAWIALQGE